VPTARILAVGTTTSRPDHDHAHGHPTGQPARITSGSAAPITNKGAAQHAAIQARLAVVVATAEETLEAHPNRVPRHVF
jgi:hypothetical protein